MKEKVREFEENIREGRSRRKRKELVGCVRAMVGNNRFLFKLEYVQRRYIGDSSLSYLCDNEEVGL